MNLNDNIIDVEEEIDITKYSKEIIQKALKLYLKSKRITKEWQKKNPRKCREKMKIYYTKNKEELLMKQKQRNLLKKNSSSSSSNSSSDNEEISNILVIV